MKIEKIILDDLDEVNNLSTLIVLLQKHVVEYFNTKITLINEIQGVLNESLLR